MFRKVRKKANEISASLAKDLIKKSRRGILAVNGDNGYPYAIPINYLYEEESQKIFFHGSKVGHKVDAIKNSDKVCFTVVGEEKIKEVVEAAKATQMFEITIEHISGKEVQER